MLPAPPVRCHRSLPQGRLPDNAQIDRALRYVHDNSPVDVSALSPEGQRLVENVRDIVNTSREIVASKNGDELLQSFVWDTRGADLATPLNQAKSQGQDAPRVPRPSTRTRSSATATKPSLTSAPSSTSSSPTARPASSSQTWRLSAATSSRTARRRRPT